MCKKMVEKVGGHGLTRSRYTFIIRKNIYCSVLMSTENETGIPEWTCRPVCFSVSGFCRADTGETGKEGDSHEREHHQPKKSAYDPDSQADGQQRTAAGAGPVSG